MESADETDADERQAVVNVDIRRYLAALRKYLWLSGLMAVFGIACAVVYTTRLTPLYSATASLQIEPRLPDLLGTGDILNVAAGTNGAEYYRQQKQVLASYSLSKLTIEQNDLSAKFLSQTEIETLSHDDQIDVATRRLNMMVTIKYPDQDRIMYVEVRNPDPELAKTIANDHVATYIAYTKGLLSDNSVNAADALSTQFHEQEAKLRAAQDKIYKFQADNDMVAVTLEQHQNLVTQNILAFSQKLNDARANEFMVGAKLAEMRKESSGEVLANPIVMMGDSNQSFELIRAQYYTEKIHLLELQKDLGTKNPDYLAQKEKVDELYKALDGEVKIIINGTNDLQSAANHTSSALAGEVVRYTNEAKLLSPKIVQYNELERQRRLVEDDYNILRARLSAMQMTGNMSQSISNVHELDPALLPVAPIWPKMPINVGAGAMASLALSFVLVFLFVFLDRSIKTAEDATVAAGVPVLGIIPALADADIAANDVRARDMYIHNHPKSHVAECCRVLRTNIMFSAADRNLKTIVVSSANEKEGKTTTVLYLGITMAQSGQKVLLIDTDMRRPRLHVSTGISREPGLSNLLLGEDNYDEVIRKTEVENLFVLPCGPLPPNPAELLMTKRFETVLEELGKRFGKIILDSPPLIVTDAVVLAKRSEGVILVARSGKTNRDELKRAARSIRTVDGTIYGIVVNELARRERDSYYYYGGGYNQTEDDAA